MTAPLRTVLDCARHRPLPDALAVADSALRAGDVGPEGLRRAADTTHRWRRRRVAHVAGMADARAANPFESELRARAAQVRGLRLEPPPWIGDIGRADLVDRRRGVVVEADSGEFHAGRRAFERWSRPVRSLRRARDDVPCPASRIPHPVLRRPAEIPLIVSSSARSSWGSVSPASSVSRLVRASSETCRACSGLR